MGQKNCISCDDKLFNNALVDESYTQAVNSPDVDLLDLGFFRDIQSSNDAAPKNKKELIEAVSEVYDKYPQHKINRTWLTLQCCSNQIITHHGNNDYNIDHIGKEQLEENGNLPDVMNVVEDVATTMTQTMMTVMMTTSMITTPLPKTKRIPILPTHKWEDEGYGQRLSNRCTSVLLLLLHA